MTKYFRILLTDTDLSQAFSKNCKVPTAYRCKYYNVVSLTPLCWFDQTWSNAFKGSMNSVFLLFHFRYHCSADSDRHIRCKSCGRSQMISYHAQWLLKEYGRVIYLSLTYIARSGLMGGSVNRKTDTPKYVT